MSRRKCCCKVTADPPKPVFEKCSRPNPYYLQSISDGFDTPCLNRDGLHGWLGGQFFGICPPPSGQRNQRGELFGDCTSGFLTPYVTGVAPLINNGRTYSVLSINNSYRLTLPSGHGFDSLIEARGNVQLGYERLGDPQEGALFLQVKATTAPAFFKYTITIATFTLEIVSRRILTNNRFLDYGIDAFNNISTFYTSEIKIDNQVVESGLTSLNLYKNSMPMFSWEIEQLAYPTVDNFEVPFRVSMSGGGLVFDQTFMKTIQPCMHSNISKIEVGQTYCEWGNSAARNQSRGVDLIDARTLGAADPINHRLAWPKADNFSFVID